MIKNTDEVRQLVEAGNFIPDAEVNGAFSASFAENPWDHTIRETAAGRSEIQSPEPTARASYLGGSVPTVVWTEYWLEAEDDVPASGPSAKHTIHFMARRKKTGEETKHWFGSATLEISNASGSDSRRVSNTTPVVTWSDPDASPPTNWVVAEPSGVLRFQPEVMRGAITEVCVLLVEFATLQQNELNPTFEPTFTTAKSLNIAKVEKSLDDQGVLHLNDRSFEVKDPDLFYVRVANAPSDLSVLKVKIATTKKSGETLDGEDEVTLTYDDERKHLSTKPMLLVSDQVDDEYSGNGVGADNAPEDRTHLAEIGGSVKLTAISIDGLETPTEHTVTVAQKKTVTVNAVVFSDSGISTTDVETLIKTQVRERFAQVGVRIEVGTVTDAAPPEIYGRLTSSEMAIYYSPLISNGLSDEGFRMIEAGRGVPTAPSNEIYVFFCKRVLQYQVGMEVDFLGYAWSVRKVGSYPSAYALRPDSEGTVRTVNPAHYSNNCFISVDRALGRPFTVSHEIGHLLTNGGHFEDFPPGSALSPGKKEQNLMRGGGLSPVNSLNSSKRLQQHQQNAIYGHPAAK